MPSSVGRLIDVNPDVMFGKLVIAGPRITVELGVEELGAGESIDEIVAAHPRLTREAVLAAVSSEAEALRRETKCRMASRAA